MLERIFPANHLTGAKKRSFWQITWLVLARQIELQPSDNENTKRPITKTTIIFIPQVTGDHPKLDIKWEKDVQN